MSGDNLKKNAYVMLMNGNESRHEEAIINMGDYLKNIVGYEKENIRVLSQKRMKLKKKLKDL
ncbi:MAG: hypothetical protein PVJ67_00070 [Candidatus Pacearchaeota archaeon]